MVPRYSNPQVAEIFTDEAKLLRWQDVELAVIAARVELGLTSGQDFDVVKGCLYENHPDVAFWLERDAELHHDLNAFLEERLRFIPPELQAEFHKDTTSYDTEDAALALALIKACELVRAELRALTGTLVEKAQWHRHTLMLERTHGQGAKLRSFGGRLLTYVVELQHCDNLLDVAHDDCHYSRLSGAIGNYGGGLTPDIEKKALGILGLHPFVGATQILPRSIHAPIAHALADLCEVLGKTALDFRLGARSGTPLWHEPFGKKQKGSSAMPHKKNTILTEQMEGMVRLARGYESAIAANIKTWEARAIEQSCVERVAWPDLFHVTMRMLSVMHKIFDGMVVYPDHMLDEILASRATYASDEAKNFLAERFAARGIGANDAYRIIQLASFCVFDPGPMRENWRNCPPADLAEAEVRLATLSEFLKGKGTNLRDIILDAELFPVASLAASDEDVRGWNLLLTEVFKDEETKKAWQGIFHPSYLLRQENSIFDYILDD